MILLSRASWRKVRLSFEFFVLGVRPSFAFFGRARSVQLWLQAPQRPASSRIGCQLGPERPRQARHAFRARYQDHHGQPPLVAAVTDEPTPLALAASYDDGSAPGAPSRQGTDDPTTRDWGRRCTRSRFPSVAADGVVRHRSLPPPDQRRRDVRRLIRGTPPSRTTAVCPRGLMPRRGGALAIVGHARFHVCGNPTHNSNASRRADGGSPERMRNEE